MTLFLASGPRSPQPHFWGSLVWMFCTLPDLDAGKNNSKLLGVTELRGFAKLKKNIRNPMFFSTMTGFDRWFSSPSVLLKTLVNEHDQWKRFSFSKRCIFCFLFFSIAVFEFPRVDLVALTRWWSILHCDPFKLCPFCHPKKIQNCSQKISRVLPCVFRESKARC